MKASAPQAALRELRLRFGQPLTWAILALAVAVLAVSGPFGTHEALAPLTRLGYWALVAPVTYAAGLLGSAFVQALLAPGQGGLRHILAAALASSLLVTSCLLVLHLGLGIAVPQGAALAQSYLAVLVICLAIEAIGTLLHPEPRPTPDPDPATALAPAPAPAPAPMPVPVPAQADPSPAAALAPALLQRLPLDKRGALVAISALDHYIEVTTLRGRALILMRLGDAIAEAAPTPGLQIHRSHWVALDQVRAAQRSAEGGLLTLPDGRVLPIARGRLAAAQQAGLFPRKPKG